MTPNLADLIVNCLPIVQDAGKMARTRWNLEHHARHKGRIDLVTETDIAIEEFLRVKLTELLPEAVFLGEESAENLQESLHGPLCWVVDPIDGTTNFVHRMPIVGVSVALCANGAPALGIIDAPMLGETYYAVSGHGAFLNDAPARVSDVANLADSLVSTGFPYDFGDRLPAIIRRLERTLPVTQGLRRPGAASIDLAWVACGRLDAYFEDGLKPWDMAAGWLLVKEAGGEVSAFDGSGADWGKSLLATNGHIHQDMVRLVRD